MTTLIPPAPKKPSTSLKVVTNRANGRRSRGPVTPEGRRRSQLNGQRLPLPFKARRFLEERGIRERLFHRFWRDIKYLFDFAGHGLDMYFAALAWDWTLKTDLLMNHAPPEAVGIYDARLEYSLQALVNAIQVRSRKFRHNLRKHLGSSGRAGMWQLHWQMEQRLPVCKMLREMGVLPVVSPPEERILEERDFEKWDEFEDWDEFEEMSGSLLFRGVRPPESRQGGPSG